MLVIIAILAWASVSLFILGLTMKGERAMVRERVQALKLALDEDIHALAPELTNPFGDRVIKPLLARLSRAFGKLLPSNLAADVTAKLERAGNPWKLKAGEFIGLQVLSLLVIGGAGAAFALLTDFRPAFRILGAAIGIFAGWALPMGILDHLIGERHRLIRRALADCLDLLVVSTEAGLAFDAALAKVVERMRGPIAQEFQRVLEDMSIGRSRTDALKAMASRVGLPELTTFVAAIRQADMLGVSIAHVLRVQAESLRVHRNLRARESAAKLPVKLLFPLVFFIFPALFIAVLGPGAIQIYRALVQ